MVELPQKTGHLALCTRRQYFAALGRLRLEEEVEGGALIEHLRPSIWAEVSTALVRKAIAEFTHERILRPLVLGQEGHWTRYALSTDQAETEYRFRARVLALEHWDIDPTSISKTIRGEPVVIDALDFFLELQKGLELDPSQLPVYLEEIASTLYSAAYKRSGQRLSAADLVHADFQEIESAMSEGHPSFVANRGCVGFDARDDQVYAPERGQSLRLVWLAAHQRYTEVSTTSDLTYERLIFEELGHETLGNLERELWRQDLDPQIYRLMPVHPWQWFNKLSIIYAGDIARRDLVCLGYGPDAYRAQQSIRTFYNIDQPHKRYVKTALSVLNMGFMRGLSADYMRTTPAINEWLAGLFDSDPYFSEHNFSILREVAGIGYRNPSFEAAAPKSSPYRKLLAALWRESPTPRLRSGQRLLTMAALLHRDRSGAALLPQLIRASGLSIDAWLGRYLNHYLAPLLHCLFRYDLAFMPHGENMILVLDANVPVGAFIKDIAEEAVIMDPTRAVPPDVQRICIAVPERIKVLSIFTDVFDGFFRYLSQILVDQAGYSDECFWRRVAECIHGYRRAHPNLKDKMDSLDLFAPEFMHSCLNRLQLRNNRQMVDLSDPAQSLQFAGTLKNPIAAFR